jgi:hypothetical protein
VQITDNFYLHEFLHSQTAERAGGELYAQQLEPPQSIIDSIVYLVESSVQPMRTLLQTPMRVSSGYRSPPLNELIGGSKRSQHMHGQAADLILSEKLLLDPDRERTRRVVDSMVYERVGRSLRPEVNASFYLFAAACMFINELDVDQLIHEFGEPGKPGWVHISASPGDENNRREILRIAGGGVRERLTLEQALRLGC